MTATSNILNLRGDLQTVGACDALDDDAANYEKTVAQVRRGIFRRKVLNCLLVGHLQGKGLADAENVQVDNSAMQWAAFAFEPYPDPRKAPVQPTAASTSLAYNLLSTRDSLVCTAALVNPVHQLLLPVLEEREWFGSRRANQLSDATRPEQARSEIARYSMEELLRRLQSKAAQSVLMIAAVHWAQLCIVRSNSDAGRAASDATNWFGHNAFMPWWNVSGANSEGFFVARHEVSPAFVAFARDVVLLQAFFIFHELAPAFLPQVEVPGAPQWRFSAFALFERTQMVGGAVAAAARNVMLPLMEPMRLVLPRTLLEEMVRRDAKVAQQLLAAYSANAKEMYRGALSPPSNPTENVLPRYYVMFRVSNSDYPTAMRLTFATVLTLAIALTMPDIKLCPELSGLYVIQRTAEDVTRANDGFVADSLLPALHAPNLARIPLQKRMADSIVSIWLHDGERWVSIRYNVSSRTRAFGFDGPTMAIYPPLEAVLMHRLRGGRAALAEAAAEQGILSSDGSRLVITNVATGEYKMRKLK